MMNSKVFDWLRTICEVILPALSTAYYGLAKLWGWGYATEICGTLAILATFIGAFVNIQRDRFNRLSE